MFSTLAINYLQLELSDTDVNSDEIEKIVNPSTKLFNNVHVLCIRDFSEQRANLGKFLGLIKNFRHLKTLKMQSQDESIGYLLREFLPSMTALEEVYIHLRGHKKEDILSIIQNNVSTLKQIHVIDNGEVSIETINNN